MPDTVLHVGGASPYDVVIGHDLLRRLPGILGDGPEKVALIFDAGLGAAAQSVLEVLVEEYGVLALGIPPGEQAKSSVNVVECWEALGEEGFTRSDVVVGFGGGATTDMAGFLAASWLRGVGYVCVPTTVLAMVDAAVGGKTGINIPAGKNLVGAFYEPGGVLCDLTVLDGLPAPEVVSGLAEVIKCGFIADTVILDLVEAAPIDALDVRGDRLAELVTRGIAVKAETVSADLRESTSVGERVGREKLNYGHTLGHAIEKQENFTWRHGEAISVGMVFAAELSARALGLDQTSVQRHRDVLASVGLPIAYSGADFDTLRATMSLDKKARGARLRFVGLPEVGRVSIIDGPDEEALRECWAGVAR